MLEELARKAPLARPDDFPAAHRRAITALETLGRHGYRSAALPRWLKPPMFFRLLRRAGRPLRRRLPPAQRVDADPQPLLAARVRDPGEHPRTADAQSRGARGAGTAGRLQAPRDRPALVRDRRRARPAAADARSGSSRASASTRGGRRRIVALVGALVVLLIAAVALRGAAMASRRIRLATRAPLHALWDVVGWAGKPPRDQSRKFAVVAIVVTTLMWFVVPGGDRDRLPQLRGWTCRDQTRRSISMDRDVR